MSKPLAHPRPVLTVLQADPLAYDNNKFSETPILSCLDLGREKQYLRERLEQGEVPLCTLDFQIATSNHIENILLKKTPLLLHLSCHGTPEYLFIENNYGGAHKLFNKHLTDWVSSHKSLKCVFIAACHSNSAGKAFINAGAEYVICCKNDEDQLGDVAARKFATSFYEKLFQQWEAEGAWGAHVQEAFDFAKASLIPCSEVKEAGFNTEDEAKKMCLLRGQTVLEGPPPPPSLFSTQPAATSKKLKLNALPPPPDNFVGRKLIMYRIMKSMIVKKSRLVTITGQKEKIGKTSLAKALARYMQEREMWGDVLWCPPDERQGEVDTVLRSLNRILSFTAEFGRYNQLLQNHETYKECLKEALRKLGNEKKFVIIINAKKMLEQTLCIGRKRFLTNLSQLIHDVLESKAFSKFIILLPPDTNLDPLASADVSTANFSLDPLDFGSSLTLFSRHCQHSNDINQEILAACHNLCKSNLENLGALVPGEIEQKAKDMDEDSFHDFKKHMVVSYLSQLLNNFHGKPSQFPTLSDQAAAAAAKPTLTQDEVKAKFLPMILEENLVYFKTENIYARRATRGEVIRTVLVSGSQETINTVADDKSWVARGKLHSELYVITGEKFLQLYDLKSKQEIRQENDPHNVLRNAGFKEYSPKAEPARVHQVDDDDMRYFLADPTNPHPDSTSCFVAPWGETTEVKMGDYLVNKGDDGVYRAEREIFENTYEPRPRTQEDVQELFLPMIREEKNVYYKKVSIYARQARKGEVIHTVLTGGDHETKNTVTNDNSWVACGKAASEKWVIAGEKFPKLYDLTSKQDIPSMDDPDSVLRNAGFEEYFPKAEPAWAHKVDRDDMRFLLSYPSGRNPAVGSTARFVAPWGETTDVKLGDYLVNKGDEGIYRVECQSFEDTYEHESNRPDPAPKRQKILDANKIGDCSAVISREDGVKKSKMVVWSSVAFSCVGLFLSAMILSMRR